MNNFKRETFDEKKYKKEKPKPKQPAEGKGAGNKTPGTAKKQTGKALGQKKPQAMELETDEEEDEEVNNVKRPMKQVAASTSGRSNQHITVDPKKRNQVAVAAASKGRR